MSSVYVNLLFSVFCTDKFSVQTHGLEWLSAILIEFSEKFQTLESQVMHIAAQEIQTEVHSMTEKEDNHKSNDRTGI